MCRAAQVSKQFARTTVITRENSSVGYCEPTAMQVEVFDALDMYRFVNVLKHRQAYISTSAWQWLLSQVEYTPGLGGQLIANRKEVAEDIWQRALYAYQQQPPEIKVPAGSEGLRGIRFSHNGHLTISTAGSDTPAIGASIDRLVCTEFGFWRNAKLATSHLFPSFAKRPNARGLIESTPGYHGSAHHELTLASLGAAGSDTPHMFHTIFLKWWLDPTCVDAAEGLQLDNSEVALVEKLTGITPGHVAFRRRMLSLFGGDERLFASKYPSSPYDCWFTTSTPAIPAAPLLEQLSFVEPDHTVGWVPEYDPSTVYVIAADPNSYGESGDPSAYTVWDVARAREVAAWSGRLDPVKLARVLAGMGASLGNCTIIVESNAPACITALVAMGYPNIYSTSQSHPGWYATKQSIDRAHGRMVTAILDKQFQLCSRQGLHQLMAYDGQKKRKDGHHWDRVVSYYMVADFMTTHPARLRPPPPQSGRMSVSDFKKLHSPPRGQSL